MSSRFLERDSAAGKIAAWKRRIVSMAFEVFTLKERPDLRSGIFAAAFHPPFFPEFMVPDRVARLYFRRRFSRHTLDLPLRVPMAARSLPAPSAYLSHSTSREGTNFLMVAGMRLSGGHTKTTLSGGNPTP